MAISSSTSRKYTVSCMGSRERYALPVALNAHGKLDRLHTDIYMPSFISDLASRLSLNSGVKALFNRNHKDLPFSKVRQQFLLGVEFRRRVRKARQLDERQRLLANYGSKFASVVASNIGENEGFVGFTGQALESMQSVKQKGGIAFLDQVDPGLKGWQLIKVESEKYAHWGGAPFSWSSEFQARVESELVLADKIIVNSVYSKICIEEWVGRVDTVVLSIPSSVVRKRREKVNTDAPLRVLFLGAIAIGKGVQYAVEAVDALLQRGFDIKLILAGELHVDASVLSAYSGHDYIGTVASSDIPALLDTVDILVFPTLSDGFGMVQTEAISRGVPVISSNRCASVVENDKSGFVIDEVSVDSIADAISIYCEDRQILSRHSEGAYLRSADFGGDRYRSEVNDMFSV